jgi:hypothetical protein
MGRGKTTSLFEVPDRPMSIVQLADWAGCSVRFIHYELSKGNLTKTRLGSKMIRIMPNDVAAWLKRTRGVDNWLKRSKSKA